MLPVPIDIALNAAVGAGVVIAAHASLRDHPLWRSPALWALVAIEAILVLPAGGYLLWRFPSWSLMYLLEPGALGLSDTAWAVLAPLAGIGTFLGTRRLVLAGHLWVGVLVLAAGVLLTVLAAYFGWALLFVVGTTEAFRKNPAEVPSIVDSELIFVLPPFLIAFFVSLGTIFWRLVLLGLVQKDRNTEAKSSPSKPGARMSGTRKTKKKAADEEAPDAAQ